MTKHKLRARPAGVGCGLVVGSKNRGFGDFGDLRQNIVGSRILSRRRFSPPQKLAISLILAVSLKTFSRKELSFLESCITSSGTIGVRLGFVWGSFGVRLVFVWCSFGVRLGFVWCSFGVRSGFDRGSIGDQPI